MADTASSIEPSPFIGTGLGFARSFGERFDKEPFEFQHRLSTDARFGHEELRALALRLPTKYYDSGNIAAGTRWDKAEKRCSFEDAVGQLETSDSWIILKRAYEDPAYAGVLETCLADVSRLTGRDLATEVRSKTMSIILTSPNRITPYHIDGDCNFLFQVRGTKTLFVFDGNDRSVLTEPEVEGYWMGDSYAAKFRESNQDKARAYAMKPGVGVHLPLMFPHWVKNDNNVSVSVSINFNFKDSLYDAYRGNFMLRKCGLRPSPVGASKLNDSLKAGLGGVTRVGYRALRKIVRG